MSRWLLGIFTHDEAVLRLGKTLLLVSVFLEPARAVNIIVGFTLKTVGDARFPLVVAVVFIWGILPVVIFINRTWGLGLLGFWICFAADEIIRACINLWRWRTGKWRAMGITEAGATASSALGDAFIVEP
jgi:Na+-driven multidrug efflux pump